jgi:hypothetical protein
LGYFNSYSNIIQQIIDHQTEAGLGKKKSKGEREHTKQSLFIVKIYFFLEIRKPSHRLVVLEGNARRLGTQNLINVVVVVMLIINPFGTLIVFNSSLNGL